MAVTLVDGFDIYNGTGANTGVQAKWSNVSIISGLNGATFSMVTGRFTGSQALRLTCALGAVRNGRTTRGLPAAAASFTFNAAIRINDLSTLNGTTPFVLSFADTAGGVYHLHFSVGVTGAISALRASSSSAGTSLGSSAAGVIVNNTWHYWSIEGVINDSTGRVTVYIDGVQVINLTSQDTRNGGNASIDTIGLNVWSSGGATATNIDFDDLYMQDTATALGERRVETLYPSADTAQKDFTASTGSNNSAMVDEAQVNGDTDYVQASTVGNTDRYTHSGLSSTPTTIDAVQVTAFAEKTDATSRSIALQVKSGATTSDGSNFALSASYGKFDRLILTDPDTAAAWGASGVNNLAFGPKVTV